MIDRHPAMLKMIFNLSRIGEELIITGECFYSDDMSNEIEMLMIVEESKIEETIKRFTELGFYNDTNNHPPEGHHSTFLKSNDRSITIYMMKNTAAIDERIWIDNQIKQHWKAFKTATARSKDALFMLTDQMIRTHMAEHKWKWTSEPK